MRREAASMGCAREMNTKTGFGPESILAESKGRKMDRADTEGGAALNDKTKGDLKSNRRSSSTLPLPFKVALIGAAGAAAAYIVRQRRCMDFAGKTVVITGGSRGLGLELARGFAAEGAAIAILARDRQQLSEAERELKQTGV